MKEMPLAALLLAWRSPRIWLLIFSETASPEASSPARTMRSPEESFSMFLSTLSVFTFNWRSAKIALML